MLPRLLCFAAFALPLACVAPDAATAAQAAAPLRLYYAQPARDWERESLPIGNGRIGASVYGLVDEERIVLNDKTLWSGGPGVQGGYRHGDWKTPRPGAIDAVRRRIARDTTADPEWVAGKLGQAPDGFGAYQVLGELRLRMRAPSGSHSDFSAPSYSRYRRTLDLETAVAGVAWQAEGIDYRREYFASFPDDVIVIHLSASKPGALNFDVRMETPAQGRSVQRVAHAGRATLAGRLLDNGLRFEAQVQVLHQGGSRSDSADGSIAVQGADTAILIVAAGTDYAARHPHYRGADPHAAVARRLDAAVARGLEQLRQRHVADYRALFDRTTLDIGQADPGIPTDALLALYRDGSASTAQQRALEALYFQYGRYLLIASSRAGAPPANLQGIWNDSIAPPWDADYHLNINLQMNYWLAETTSLSETAEPLFAFVEGLVEPGRASARTIHGAPGWVSHLGSNVYGYTGMIEYPTAFWFPESAAWLSQHLYEHYRFSGDVAFLRERAWPVMRGAAEFWLSQLQTDPRDGSLVVTPSFSPEHGAFSAGAAMSQQIVRQLLDDAIAASQILDTAAALRTRLVEARARLDTGLRIGRWGQLQEWKHDADDPLDQHRHVSQLFALHPAAQVSPLATPDLAAAARATLDARGDGGTGWSKAWKINFRARLFDGDHAWRMLNELLRLSTLDNLWDTHPPFQIDGNFGATAGIAEMLLQSHAGAIHVLPALPSAWPDGEVRGLRARGAVGVDIRWRRSRAEEITLHAGRDGPVSLRSDLFTAAYDLVDLDNGHRIQATRGDGVVTFQARAGHRYRASRRTGRDGPPGRH